MKTLSEMMSLEFEALSSVIAPAQHAGVSDWSELFAKRDERTSKMELSLPGASLAKDSITKVPFVKLLNSQFSTLIWLPLPSAPLVA